MADALAHVLRVFQSDTVPHEKGSVDPLRDLSDVEAELILSDLMVVEKRLERLERDRKKIKNADLDHEFDLLERVPRPRSKRTQPLREMNLTPDDEKRIRGFPVPLPEAGAVRAEYRRRGSRPDARDRGRVPRRPAGGQGAVPEWWRSAAGSKPNWPNSPPEEAREYLASYGLKESGLERLIAATYSCSG